MATTGLAGEWRLDQGAGAIASDSAGAGLHGQLGTGSNAPRWIPGVRGTALRFDGDDHVRLPDSPLLEPEYISVEAWVRRAGTPGSYRYVVSKGATTCAASSYGLYTGSSQGLAFYVSKPGGYVVSPQATPASVWNGAWHHVVGTYDGDRVRLYVDGHQRGLGAAAPDDMTYGLPSRSAYIGSYRGTCELPFTGDIDGVRLWRVALEADEVKVAAGQPEARPEPPDNDVGGEPPASEKSKSCLRITPNRRLLRVQRRSRVIVTVRRGGKRVAKVRVAIYGGGIKRKVKRTNRRGRVTFVVTPRRMAKLRVRVSAQPKSCPSSTLRVKGS